MRKFLGMILLGCALAFNSTATYASFWEEETTPTIFDDSYVVESKYANNMYKVYQSHFIKLRATDVTDDEIKEEYMANLSSQELDYLMLGACNDLFDKSYVDYKLVDMIFDEYGKRNNPLYKINNPMLGMDELVSEQKQKAFNNQYPYFIRFPQQVGNNVYNIDDPGLVANIIDSYFEIAPINDDPIILYPQLMGFLDRESKASYYYISNHKNLEIRQKDCDLSLQINFDNYYRGRIDNIRIQSNDPEVIDYYTRYFKNTKSITSSWCKIASGKDYIEFYNMYTGSYRINKILTDAIKQKERERYAMERSFIQADIDYYNSLFND